MNKSVPRYDGNRGPYFYESLLSSQDISSAKQKGKTVFRFEFYEDKVV